MRRLLLICVLALAVTAPALAADPEIEDGSAQAALDAARGTWAAEGFGGDYDWWVNPGPFEPVRVRGGVGEQTVLQLFDRLQKAIADRVADYEVQYGERGVPRYVRADSFFASVGAIRAAGRGEAVLAALADARARWAQTGLRDYDVTVRVGCFCPPATTAPKVVHVRGGEPFEPNGLSVEAIFDFIENNADAYVLNAEYAADGHPVSVYADQHPNVADEERGFTISNLTPATYDPAAQAALDAAKAQWEREKLANYGYRVRTLCFCPSQITRIYAVHVRKSKPVRSHKYIRSVDTVEKLFARIQSAITDEAFAFRVTYGPRGVPTFIALNPSAYIVDEETTYAIGPIHPEPAKLPPKVALSILSGTAAAELRLARENWKAAGRPHAKRVRAAYARIERAIRQRARVLTVTYNGRGEPTRIVTRP